MEKELEKLIQRRKNLVNALKENEAEGIHALLSDLYPDTAHFIFELLQNAEDMNATTVRFILDHNGIDFEHNGTKRDFNISDIDAITNIGHNKQKKDDPTSIGKFGVGFKAVFGYTSTPIIHSGNYHFKIEDYFVPEFNGINAISTIDNSGVSWTKFSFPFNNPDKPADKAFEECLHGLEALDSTSILFLQNIQKIEYMLPSGDLGYVECTEGRAHHITITYKKPDNNVETKSTWLRFNRVVDMIDDQGNNKTLPIAVAFSIASKNHKEKIIPVNGMGKTFIYFPAEKEHSGLRFHINAPFASTVARDSVRNCTDNTKLIKEISKLIVDSLPKIKAQGLMNSSFFEVLPNGKEDIPFFYSHIYDYIDVAFRNNEYLPTQNGGYVTSKAAITGPAEISNLLDDEDIKMLTGMDKHWILKAPQKNSNADNFINSLNIEIFSYNEFTEIFDITNRKQTEDLICEKNKSIGNKWLEKLYTLCINTYNTYNNIMEAKRRSTFIDNLKRSTIIKGVDGQLYKPKDILILPINVSLVTKTTPIVEQEFVLGEAKNRIREFFKNQLNIREYGPKVEIESRLQKYADEAYYGTYDNIYSSMIYGVEFNKNEEYFNDILSFAKYKVQYNDIHFEYEKLFVYRNESDNKLYRTSAAHLYLGKKYNNTNGELLAEICGKKCLWDGYAEHYKDDELKLFLEFATSCGASKELKIEQQSAAEHPLYRSELWSDGKSGSLGEDSDYTIPYLEKLLKANSYKVNRLIWKTLVRYGKKEGYKYIEARYAQSGRVKVKTCDSSLIYYLKQYAWIPDKQDVFYKPADIEIDNLGKDFVYSQSNKILEALQIGSAFDEKKRNWLCSSRMRKSLENILFLMKIISIFKTARKNRGLEIIMLSH